jgi:hypothetical protein
VIDVTSHDWWPEGPPNPDSRKLVHSVNKTLDNTSRHVRARRPQRG